MKKILFLAVMLFTPAVYAADTDICTGASSCEDLPACESLGYTKDRYCPEGYITCPFDTDYIWCKTYECGMGGYLNADSEEIAIKKAQGYICKKAKFHGLECYECDTIDGKACKYNDLNKGEGTLKGQPCADGKYPECESKCALRDKTIEVLAIEGAIPVREICTACGIDEVIVTDFVCDESYVKDEEHFTCVPAGCPKPTTYTDIPYEATGLINCETKTHSQGWRYETNGVSGKVTCSRCVPKNCPLGSEANVSGCPNEVGYLYIANGYSGDAPCGYCESLRCADPYTEAIQSIADCKTLSDSAWTASKAWTFEYSTQQSGDKVCGLCVPNECAEGYAKTYQSVNDCPNKVGYEFKYDTSRFYGDKYCGKCEPKSCSVGKTNLLLSECVTQFGSSIGTKVVSTEEYSANRRCQKCECDASECAWKASNIGANGQGVSICCDGLSYKSCTSSCEGDEVISIPNAQRVSKCTACGHTYLKVEECNAGYKLDGNSCVQKNCSDWRLKATASECAAGYKAVQSAEHPQCYACAVKTCADWGKDVSQTWYDSSVLSCAAGYEKTAHMVNVGGEIENCFDCEKCTSKNGYVTVDSEEDIPAYVVVLEKFKSCDKYQYCATSCLAGYALNGCACEPVNCEGYTDVSGLKQHSGNIWTDSSGSLKYELCQTAGQNKFKLLGCMSGFSDVSCNESIGEYAVGVKQGSYKCYQCSCSVSTVEDCKWTAANMGDGRGVTVCCDGTTYKGCTQDTSKCNYTLTEKPANAKTTDTCMACGVTYHKVTECKTGYKGETCSVCDTANGYGSCNGECSQKPNCENGTPVCSTTGWVCGCAQGYAGNDCSECNTEAGYGKCNGICVQRPVCAHGTATCESTGWKCNCDSCYTGTHCDMCDTGCKDFGSGCVENNSCNGHGTYNGTKCVCNECYTGNDCSEHNPLCNGDTPKTCESEGYSSSCNVTCQICEDKQVETVGATLNCYDVLDKSCMNFCGKYDIDTEQVSIEETVTKCNSIQGSARLYKTNNAIYAWLSDEANGSTVKRDNGCDAECYFNDINCSDGEKLTPTEKEDREKQGFMCKFSGYTPAGSLCYNCADDRCLEGYVNEDDVPEKESNGYYCVEKANMQTTAGKRCYECLDDTCEEGYILSEEEITRHFDDDFILSDTEYYRNNAGHYCYKMNGEEKECMSVTANATYTNTSNCTSKISDMKDYGGYPTDIEYVGRYGYSPAASCHQCMSSNGQKKILWYPSCRKAIDIEGTLLRDYAQVPQDGGLEFKNGSNCCFKEYVDDDEVYTTETITISAYTLGTSANAETCYALDKRCAISLVEDSYCTGTKCVERTCSTNTYPYYNDGNGTSTIPAHSSVSGDSCTNRTESCVTGPVYYKDFTCHELSHVKDDGGTGCTCNGRGYYNSESDCLGATRNIGHNCKFDSSNTECWIQGECHGDGYYETEAACKEANEGHSCYFDSNATRCWIDGGCDIEQGRYGSEESCTSANKGHKCVADSGCYIKGACNTAKGYFDTDSECKTSNLGFTCGYDSVTKCYIKDSCDNSKGFYDKMTDCENANPGYTCNESDVKGCYIKTGDCSDGYCQFKSVCYEIQTCPTSYIIEDSSLPEHSHGLPVDMPCTPRPAKTCIQGQKKWKDWACDDGYVKSGNSCVACTPSCPSGWFVSSDNSEGCVAQKSDGCGGTITCYKAEACQTTCSNYGMIDEQAAWGQSCKVDTTFVNDYGEEIECFDDCSPCEAVTCPSTYRSSQTGNYTNLVNLGSKTCPNMCYCSLDCGDRGDFMSEPNISLGYTHERLIYCGDKSKVCYAQPRCAAYGLSTAQTSYYTKPIYVEQLGVTCYAHTYLSGDGNDCWDPSDIGLCCNFQGLNLWCTQRH